MTIEIRSETLEARILRILLDVYPMTDAELLREIGVKKEVLDRALNALAVKGILTFDILPDKKYIRLLRTDFRFVGRNPTQKKALKRKGKQRRTPDYDGMMFR